MKSAIKALCFVFLIGVIGLGYYLAWDNGVTYEFVEEERIENFTEQKFASTVGKVYKNEKEAEEEKEFTNLSSSQTYKCNVKLQQAEWRLIEKATGVMFTKKYTKKIDSIKGTVKPNEYAWVEFTPEMTKITGYIIEKHGGQEAKKTYVEIVYPKADAENKSAPAGTVEFKTAPEKPAEKLS